MICPETSPDTGERSEDRFRQMVEASQNIFFFERGEDLRLSYISPSCKSITGYEAQELIGRKVSEFMCDPESIKNFDCAIPATALFPFRRPPYMVEGRHRNGSVICAEVSESYSRDALGKLVVRGFALDITARKTAERQLELSDQILRRINAIVVVANGEGQIVYVTPSTSRVLGFTAAELLGYGWWRHEHRNAEISREACEAVGAAARGERSARNDVWEEISYDKNGHPHWLLWQEAKGPGDLLIGIAQDITDKKKVDEELSRRSAQLRAIFDNASEGMFIVNDDFRYVDANPAGCAIFGCTRAEIIGQQVGAFSPPNTLSPELWRKIREQGSFVGEHQILRKNGTRVDVDFSIKLAILPGLHLAMMRDVTDRKRLENQFLQSQKMEALGRLAGGVAHDVNNMLMAIRGFLTTQDGQYVLGYQAVAGVIDQSGGLAPIQLGKGQINSPNPTSYLQMKANLNAAAQVGDPAYSSQMIVCDSLGASHALTFQFTKTAANTWSYDVTIPAAEVGKTGAPVSLSSGSLSFDGNGQLTTPATDVTGVQITGLANGASNLTFDWHLFDNGASMLTQMSTASNVSSSYQDGFSSGSLQDFSIGSDGVIQGSFTNGTKALAQIALANFANLQGLNREGQNCFSSTLSSGQAVIGAAGTGGRGTLSGGALELSNVDIAKEFANLITAQRGYEANARTITAFDEIMQDTINLKR